MESFLELMNAAPDTEASFRELNIGVISNGGTEPLGHVLAVLLSRLGLKATVHSLPLSSYLHPTKEFMSAHAALKLHFVILLPLSQDLKRRYYETTDRESFGEVIWEEQQSLLKILNGVPLLMANLVQPLERIYGQFEASGTGSFFSFVRDFNKRLLDRASHDANLTIIDFDRLAGDCGRKEWYDQRAWTLSRLPCSPHFLPQLGQTLSQIIASRMGKVIKCIILDADQVLWPEILDEVGPDSILSTDNPESESFIEFQHYLLELSRRGILLSVCSKNEEENIRRIFRTHPRMVLRESSVVSYQVSWDDKAQGIRSISTMLNIGPDSLVFIDDSPFERENVRSKLPEVTVPEISPDPMDTIKILSELNLFEAGEITAEDRLRTVRPAVSFEPGSGQTTEEFLKGLEMKAALRLAEEKDLPRLTQLFQRANQFNMMTRRYSHQELANMIASPQGHVLLLSVSDRLGDLGMISALVLQRVDNTLEIRDWVLSCRAFSRNLEHSLMGWLSQRAQGMGCSKLLGLVLPNGKNHMARHFYQVTGFNLKTGGAVEHWELVLPSTNQLTISIHPIDEINEDLWKMKFHTNS